MGELIIPVLLIVVSVLFYMFSGTLKVMPGTPMSSGTYPRVLAVLLFCCAIIIMIQFFMRRKEHAEAEKGKVLDKNIFLVALLLFAFYFCLNYLGYIISTIILGILLSLFFQKKKPRVFDTFILPVLLSTGLYYAFHYMGVYFTVGKLINAIF